MKRHRHSNRARRIVWLFLGTVGALVVPVGAVPIIGVQNAALDQPRINAALRLPGESGPLVGVTTDFFGNTFETFNIQAFYDTGASGILVSQETASVLGLSTFENIVFEDVGIGGTEAFDVSEEVFVHLAPFTASQGGIDDRPQFSSVYTQQFGPHRLQVNPHSVDPFVGIPLDVFGMPLFAGKVVAMDARPVNQVIGTIDTTVYDAGAPMPGVPAPDLSIQMSFADFSRFTQTLQDDGQGNMTPIDPAVSGPSLADNPFIGPNPLAGGGGVGVGVNSGVRISFDGMSSTGSWLFDTGASASIVSTGHANAVGVQYRAGAGPGSFLPRLERISDGTLLPNQFTLTIGGIGGSTTVSGFFADSLVVPTIEGDPLEYLPAPMLVADITVVDPNTQEVITLDGVFGMNYLVASLFVDGFIFGDLVGGPFEWLVFDQTTGILGLTFDPNLEIPEPILAAWLLPLLLLRRRQYR